MSSNATATYLLCAYELAALTQKSGNKLNGHANGERHNLNGKAQARKRTQNRPHARNELLGARRSRKQRAQHEDEQRAHDDARALCKPRRSKVSGTKNEDWVNIAEEQRVEHKNHKEKPTKGPCRARRVAPPDP